MLNDYFVNLTRQDWTDANLRVIKNCKEQTDKAVAAYTNISEYPFLGTPHLPVVTGVSRWAIFDYFLEAAAKKGSFDGIEPRWIDFQGAAILELRGKYTSLTACHVLTSDEKPKESEKGYRKNNRAKNQKNLELFKEFEASASDDDLIHVVLRHGGRNDNFAFLGIYLEESDFPALTGNIMLMPSLEMAPEAEPVMQPTVTLKDPTVVAQPENVLVLQIEKDENDDSTS